MSILQDLEQIRNGMDEKTQSDLDTYLSLHPDILLSDVYYSQEEWEKFAEWQELHDAKAEIDRAEEELNSHSETFEDQTEISLDEDEMEMEI